MSKISELISTTSPVQVSTTAPCGCKDFLDDNSSSDGEYKCPDQPISITIPTVPDEHNYDNSSTVINQEIDHPRHYASKSGRDVIDWCEDFGLMDNAYVFNVFKYLCRAGKKSKNSVLQDALKARIYLNRFIENLQK